MRVCISFIVPIYHGNHFISHIIKQIVLATRKVYDVYDVEIILVNDYPEEIINVPIGTDINVEIKVVSNSRNLGIHQSRVNGLRISRGKYIIFLDQDDSINENYLSSQLQYMDGADVVICNGIYHDNQYIVEGLDAEEIITDEYVYSKKLSGIISPGQALIRRNAIPNAWLEFILQGNYCDDAFLWLLLKDRGCKFAYNRNILYKHNEDGNNTSLGYSKNVIALEEMFDVIENNNLIGKEMLNILQFTVGEKIKKHEKYSNIEKVLETFESEIPLKKEVLKHKKIAIYGYGNFGKRLCKMFLNNNLPVSFVTDKKIIDTSIDGLKYYRIDEDWPGIDFLIITPVMDYREINLKLINKDIKNIISIENIALLMR